MAKAAPEGRYFFIVAQQSDKYLTVCDEVKEPGTPVVIWEKLEPASPSQMWFEDELTGTLRTKLNQMCLTVNDDEHLVIDNYQEDLESQKWSFNVFTATIKNLATGAVADVLEGNTESGSPLAAMEATGEQNQKFACEKISNQFFTLVSEFSGMCLEAEGKMMGVKAGAKIIVGEKDQKDNQLWYEDKNGVIRSKLKGMGMVCKMEQGANITIDEYEADNPLMQWRIMPNKSIGCVTEPSNVFDIKGRKTTKGAEVIVWQWTEANNQMWNVEYYQKKSKKSKKKKASDDEDSDSD